MCVSPRVHIKVDLQDRAEYILQDYNYLIGNTHGHTVNGRDGWADKLIIDNQFVWELDNVTIFRF